MGIKDTEEMNRNVPVVHPVLKVSECHFRRNTAILDGRYRVLDEQRQAYKDAPEVKFDDILGLVFISVYVTKTYKNFIIYQVNFNFF